MGLETWFRGEAVGVSAVPGKWEDHDFVSEGGLYLTNQPEVARQYSRTRSSDPASWRVYSVNIDRGSMRVLDLTTDPRWAKLMTPGNEELIRLANKNYGEFFRGFVKAEKIDLSKYDAVMGPEYVRGGVQLCILPKNGAQSSLATRIRAKFVQIMAEPSAMSTRTPKNATRRIGPGLRAIGGAAAMGGIAILTMWLFNKYNAQIIQKQMRDLEPRIDEALRDHKAAIADLQLNGAVPYANVTLTYTDTSTSTVRGSVPSFTVVEMDVAISASKIETPPRTSWENVGVSRVATTVCTYSFEVALPDDEINLYRTFKLELQWYEDQCRKPGLAPQDRQRLSLEKMELEARFRRALGN